MPALTISRRFTRVGQDPFETIAFTTRRSAIYNTDGSVNFEMDDVEVPADWSQVSVDILVSKFFRKAGVPQRHPDGSPQVHPDGSPVLGPERSARDWAMRLANAWRLWGTRGGYFASDADADAFRDEVAYLLITQAGSPNSPQHFNTGLFEAYGIVADPEGNWYVDPDSGEVTLSTHRYERSAASACYINAVNDELVGDGSIFDFIEREARLFKAGSGSGVNMSNLRAKGEKLSGGGTASGVMSFMRVADRAAGAIKSGGTCLAPWTRVYTETGPVAVQDLAEAGGEFITFGYNPIAGRVQANRSRAFLSGRKQLVRLVTDKGEFAMSADHPVLLMGGGYCLAGDLTPGMSVRPGNVTINRLGYHRIGLHDGNKGKAGVHRLIARDVLGLDITGREVHHIDHDPANNRLENLEVYSRAEHLRVHAAEDFSLGRHPLQRFHGKGNHPAVSGDGNGMSFASGNRTADYAENWARGMAAAGVPQMGQEAAARQRMLNKAYEVVNNNGSIDTFDDYFAGRVRLAGGMGYSKSAQLDKIEARFGSFDAFREEVRAGNHRVVAVESLDVSDVYDVQVFNDTPEDRSDRDGHNFLIVSERDDDLQGFTGIYVHNTRRAAKMVVLDADHPEIDDFIWCKVREEEKVAALVAGGFSADWNGEAYDTVSFQNANNSVRIPDAFMSAVDADRDWHLTARSTGEVLRTVPARQMWRDIAEAAWRCADPGLQFDGTLNAWNTAANDGRLRATNPCSEYTHLDDTACNLASLNLTAFWDDDSGVFDIDTFTHAVRLFTVMLEITVSMSHYPSARVAERSFEHRTLGLGYANLGALLMRAGLPYDSERGRAATAAITALMHDTAYATSAELAAAVGPCVAWGRNVEPMTQVLANHARAAWGTRIAESGLGDYVGLNVRPVGIDHTQLAATPFAPLSDAVVQAATAMLAGTGPDGVGYRNMQVTVLAPTGTIGLQMGVDTTGVEPDFALVKFKKLAGGGYLKIVNGSVAPALRTLGYTAAQVDRIVTHAVGTGTLDGDTPVNRRELLARGVPVTAVDAAEGQLAAVTDLAMAFAPYVVGTDTLEQLGFDDWATDGFDLLTRLGFSADDVTFSSLVICGHQTVEGAADLDPAHLAVFDTATYCGDGTRAIAWDGHVRALAAVAPHLSGSASKTVNLPNAATIDDIESVYDLAYRLGVKAVAVYRDGSKLSQVLSSGRGTTSSTDGDAAVEVSAAIAAARELVAAAAPGTSPTSFYHGTTPPKFRMADQRFGPTWKLNVGGTEVFLRANEYDDGTLGEIFIDLSKEGSTLKGVLSCFAISVSQGLQHGVPLAKFVDTFTFHNFAPQGMVTGHANLKMASSIIDAIFKVLAFHYLDRTDLVQVPRPPAQRITRHSDGAVQLGSGSVAGSFFDGVLINDATPATPATSATSATSTTSSVTSRSTASVTSRSTASVGAAAGDVVQSLPSSAASGETCHNCGGPMVKSGTCSRCLNCGESSGCS